ncbi:MAG: bamA [Gammaproteobacteria bacterium]|nr:bamA [Gammaproteobacteria bacterium]
MIFIRRVRLVCILLLCLLTQSLAMADTVFVIKRIDVQGLQRVSVGTVLSYLPIAAGDTLRPQDTRGIIDSLYKTGFFDNVTLDREGNTLIIKVVERPTLGDVKITGNQTISTDKINEILKDAGVEKGRVFNNSTLTNIQKTLEAQYVNLGRYNANVKAEVISQPRNRVDINITISEGKVAKIRQISIVGNKVFPEDKLLSELQLKPPSFWALTFLTQADLYNKEKLDADLERLKSYYLDRGYLQFKISSTQVSVSPDRKSVYILIHIIEGEKYTFSGFKLSGDLILPEKTLGRAITIKPGDVFSRKTIIDADTKMGNMLGNEGYAFARIVPDPKIDEKKREVFVNFVVNPGKRVYVRRISFTGNVKTADYALRQTLRQFEASIFSLGNIQESERQLKKSGYAKTVEIKTPVVPGTEDQVDLDFNVTENPSATAYVSVGYGTDGVQFGAGLSQQNFLGTGNYLNLNYSQTDYSTYANLSYNNPYFKANGTQLGYALYYSSFDPTDLDLSNYSTDRYGGRVTYSIPVSEKDDFITLGLGLEHQNISEEDDPPTEVVDFVNQYGETFDQAIFSLSWSRNGYDQPIFPTAGLNQSLYTKMYAPIDSNSLTYYTAVSIPFGGIKPIL